MGTPLSVRFPAIRPIAVRAHQARRRARRPLDRDALARERRATSLPHFVREHRSPLRRGYPGVDERLQDGKAHNLGLATARVDGLLIGPGQTFSFNRVVGGCTRRRGYVEGLRLDDGSAVTGVGGDVCALSNRGGLRVDAAPTAMYRVAARNERFERVSAESLRSNEIWRIDERTAETGGELVRRNRARVAYPVPTTEPPVGDPP